MAENGFITRSLGKEILDAMYKDPYADGKAARIWENFIGDKNSRTKNYKPFLVNLLRKNGCQRILDVACGTGIDSVMLLEEGFEVVSVDASIQMLKYALKTRWERRKEAAFDKWVIEEANWLSLHDDMKGLTGDGFDAVLCLGNSFSHLLDNYGDQRDQKKAIRNFQKCIKPGGLLVIDHRNYESILETGKPASEHKYTNVYYNPKFSIDIRSAVLYVSGKPAMVTRDYLIDTSSGDYTKLEEEGSKEDRICQFRFHFHPHQAKLFSRMLQEIFGENSQYKILGDFKPFGAVDNPEYYVHIVEKSL